MNVHISRALAAAAIAGAALGSAWTGTAIAHADESYALTDGTVVTIGDDGIEYVDLRELPTIDTMPVCHLEDGSDIDPSSLPCIWGNEGNVWLTYSDRSFIIEDVTDGHVSDMDLGA